MPYSAHIVPLRAFSWGIQVPGVSGIGSGVIVPKWAQKTTVRASESTMSGAMLHRYRDMGHHATAPQRASEGVW